MDTPKQPLLTSINTKGEYVRKSSTFRDWVRADGSTKFLPERDRYHLYVSLACPWAHRTLIVRKLKGLESVISHTVVDWLLQKPPGWSFTDSKPKCSLDTINNCENLKQIYALADPEYSGNITVPVLWDKKNKTIVSNESSEILRMLNSEFNEFCETDEQRKLDLYPETIREKIDEINEWVYPEINNGVYRCGFATSQEAYDDAVEILFKALEKVEDILSKSRYLTGSTITEADVRLFTSLVRFDSVYVLHFKCNKKRIVDFPNLWAYTRDIYQKDGIGDTVDFEHIKYCYMRSQRQINPTGIVAAGPDLDFTTHHGRELMA